MENFPLPVVVWLLEGAYFTREASFTLVPTIFMVFPFPWRPHGVVVIIEVVGSAAVVLISPPIGEGTGLSGVAARAGVVAVPSCLAPIISWRTPGVVAPSPVVTTHDSLCDVLFENTVFVYFLHQSKKSVEENNKSIYFLL